MSPEPRKWPLELQQGCPNPASHGENTVNPFHSGTLPNFCQLVPTVRHNSGESGFVFYKGMLRGKRQSLPKHASSHSVFTGRANKKSMERDSWLGIDAFRSNTRKGYCCSSEIVQLILELEKMQSYGFFFVCLFHTVRTVSNASLA